MVTTHKRMSAGLLLGLVAGMALAQEPPAPLSLAELERMALESNPAISQANFNIRAASGMAKQAGLYPNPVIGATGDQISTGEIGAYGGFVEQRIVTGGKLSKSRLAAAQDEVRAKAQAEGERFRVLNAVRKLYYRALGDQRLIEVRTSMQRLAEESVLVSSELANVGLADKPDQLTAKVEAQRVRLSLLAARNARDRTWRELAAAVNNASLRPGPLAGDLDHPPAIRMDEALASILKNAPQLQQARADAAKAALMVRRAKAEKIPDLQLRGGVRYNREMLEGLSGPNSLRSVGVEGFFDAGVEIPLFNRNQGGVQAAQAEAESARLEVENASLAIRKRLAGVFQEYSDATEASERYREDMIPAAQQAYDMYLKNYRAMAGPYSQVLAAQRSLFELQEEYVNQLVTAWQAAVEINGFLY
ncbi:MAG TPA: TolC family protein [Bryobacteraceae bacterium]|nr:TolC family protein [Bryobacteraceae bacterium]